jgi:polysaccharide export outer membrane protein
MGDFGASGACRGLGGFGIFGLALVSFAPQSEIVTMKTIIKQACLTIIVSTSLSAGLAPGDRIQLTIRGVDPAEQEKINGSYRIGESGGVRLPFLSAAVQARGLTTEQFARSAEAAYRNEGIYVRPAIEVEPVQGGEQDGGPAVISLGGQVRRAGETPYRKGMTVIQAIDAAGGRNEFGGRNLLLFRDGKQYCLDFTQLAHKNIVLKPGDSIQVEQKGAITDRWKGSEEKVKELMK